MIKRCMQIVLCAAGCALVAACGFHLRSSAALPTVMQKQVYLDTNGGGEFPRSLAAALRANKVNVLDTSTEGVATLSVPVAGFPTRLITTGGYQHVNEYQVAMRVKFKLVDADGKTVIPMQTLELSHDFVVDQSQLAAVASETEAIERSLVREMTGAVMRRLEAQARKGALATPAPAGASSVGPAPAGTSGNGFNGP